MPLDIPDNLQKAAAAKSINDQINYYIAMMDTKASVFLAGNVAAASFLLKDMPVDGVGRAAYFLALTLFATSTLVAGGVIFPRLPAKGNSIIFWGDIAAKPDAKTYVETFNRTVEEGFLDEQYAVQNFLAARLMRRKLRWLRTAISVFFTALFLAFFVYLWAPHHS